MTVENYLKEVRARLSAATPGPWTVCGGEPKSFAWWVEGPDWVEDLQLMAGAPTDLARMADMLEVCLEALHTAEFQLADDSPLTAGNAIVEALAKVNAMLEGK